MPFIILIFITAFIPCVWATSPEVQQNLIDNHNNFELDNRLSLIPLTAAEYAFVKTHPVIRISSQFDWQPFDFIENNRPQGYSVDLMQLIAARIGIEFKFVPAKTHDELINLLCAGQIDLMHAINKSDKLQRCAIFSEPYIYESVQFLVRNNIKTVNTLQDLFGYKIAIPKDYEQTELIKNKYADKIHILETENIEEAINAVNAGKADFTADYDSVLNYYVNKLNLANLKIQGFWAGEGAKLELDSLHIAIRSDWQIFNGIINKALAAITPAEKHQLHLKWFNADKNLDSTIALTDAERAYLARKGVIKMCVLPDWLPYMFINEQGIFDGIAADGINLINQRLGVKFIAYPTKNWHELISAIRTRQCDIIPIANDAPALHDTINFTKPFIIQPLVIATEDKEIFINDIKAIGERKIGITANDAVIEMLRQRFPKLKLIAVNNAYDGLERVRQREIWGYIGGMTSVGYTLQKYAMLDLKIAGKFEIKDELCLASRNDEPLLALIMQKATSSLTAEDTYAIINRWISVKYEHGFDYTLLWKIGSGMILVLLGFYAWNRKLARFNREIQAKNDIIAHQHEMVKTTLDQIATLFDHADEGFLSINANLLVNEAYSLECKRIFNDDIAFKKIDELLCPVDIKARKFLAEALQAIFNATDDYERDLYFGLLSSEYNVGGHFLTARYRLLKNGNLMIVLNDTTTERELQAQIEREQLRLRFVVDALKNRNDFLTAISDFRQFLANFTGVLFESHVPLTEIRSELFRSVHTFKGIFSQFNFQALPTVLHNFESVLANVPNVFDKLTLEQLFLEFKPNLLNKLEDDLATIRQILGADFLEHQTIYPISEESLQEIERKIANLPAEQAILEVMQFLRKIRYKPFRELINTYPEYTLQLAKRMDKILAPFAINGGEFKVDSGYFSAFCKSLIHVFRNAIDHGIESPEERLMTGKNEQGTINCSIQQDGNYILITITDDGCGINREKLIAVAAERGINWQGDPCELIFAEALSTREEITDLSGRGIGLAAVRAELIKLNGHIVIDSIPNQGTTLRFYLPHHHN